MAEDQYTSLTLTLEENDEVSVTLSGFEIPDSFPLGGLQRLAVVEYIGFNSREIQRLGAQPRHLEWTGKFYYDSALDRARYLDTFRLGGDILILRWGDYQFRVIIDKFYYNAKNRFNIEYEIGLTIISQDLEVLNFTVRESLDTVDRGILDIIERIQDALSIVTRAVAIVDAIRRGDVNSIIGALSNITSIFGTIAGQFSLLTTAQISQIVAFAQIGAVAAVTLAQNMERYIDGFQDNEIRFGGEGTVNPVAEAVSIGTSFQILAGLVARLTVPAATSSVTITSGNIFRVALEHYGTLDAWQDIAAINDLNSAIIQNNKTIQLPPRRGKAPQKIPSSSVYDLTFAGKPDPESA